MTYIVKILSQWVNWKLADSHVQFHYEPLKMMRSKITGGVWRERWGNRDPHNLTPAWRQSSYWCKYVVQTVTKGRRKDYHYLLTSHLPRVGSGACRIRPPRFLTECRKRRLNQASFVLSWVVYSSCIVCMFNLSSVLNFPAWSFQHCADQIVLHVGSLTNDVIPRDVRRPTPQTSAT